MTDAGHESSKVDGMVNRGIMKISFIPENQIERLLAEFLKSRFTGSRCNVIRRCKSNSISGGGSGIRSVQ
jgi:hypothetical protein